MKIRYTDRALNELDIAIDWYERQSQGLGLEFLSCVELAVEAVTHHPKAFPEIHPPFRRCLPQRFPFSIFYTLEDGGITIHAVFNNRLDPQKQP